ncbi:MAG: cation diffusion facilitator family transporter [Rhodospirillales bacterium]|nr:cation diffusion facilitator family transporter [Rhodospirillales bacterium]
MADHAGNHEHEHIAHNGPAGVRGPSHHHDHAHSHGHAHAGHGAHGTRGADNERRIFLALLLTASFLIVEVVGGFLSGSLALLADAGHMLADVAALGLSFAAVRASRQPATLKHSYGLHRLQVLAAFINGATLIAITLWIAVEAAQRLFSPVPVFGGMMALVAAAGLAINIASFAILHGGDRHDLNVRGAALHVLGDLLGSVAAIVAAIVILATGWTPIDPILSVFVALLILRSAWSLVGRSFHVLMEGAPDGVDIGELRTALVGAVPGVNDIHHVHLWLLTPDQPLMTLHASIDADADHDDVLHKLRDVLRNDYDIRHVTIQIERIACLDPGCEDEAGHRQETSLLTQKGIVAGVESEKS